MPKHRAFINGTNFQMFSEDSQRVETLGFYTNAFVEADSPQSAEMAAVELIRLSPALRATVQNAADNPPRIFVEELQEIADWPPDTVRPLQGFGFYDEAEESTARGDENI